MPPDLRAVLAQHSALVVALEGDADVALAAMPLPQLNPAQEAALHALACSGAPPHDPLPPFAVCHVAATGALRPCFDGLAPADLAALEAAIDYLQLPVAWSGWCAQEAAARAAKGGGGGAPLAPSLQPLLTVAADAANALLAAVNAPYSAGVVMEAEVAAAMEAERGWDTVAAVVVHVCAGREPPDSDQPPAGALKLHTCFSRLAARAGNLPALLWANGAGFPCGMLATEAAAEGGHLVVLQWLILEAGCGWRAGVCSAAAFGGHLEVLQWARQQGCPWDADTCASAAAGGHLAVLQWARAHGCPWDESACREAARSGHLTVLQWLVQAGCPWDVHTCRSAAGGGHLAVLQWARANGCPWNEYTCASAAACGHLAVLQWARAHGCPWDWRTLSGADQSRSAQVHAWVVANWYPT